MYEMMYDEATYEYNGYEYDWDDIWEIINNDMDDEFDEWLNKQYDSPAKLLTAIREARFVDDFYGELWDDFTNHVLANPTIYGIFTNKIEDDEDG